MTEPTAEDTVRRATAAFNSGKREEARRLCEEGLRRANLAADYVRTSPVVAEAFTNPPGYNSLSANVAMLKAGGKRGGFVRDRHGNRTVAPEYYDR